MQFNGKQEWLLEKILFGLVIGTPFVLGCLAGYFIHGLWG